MDTVLSDVVGSAAFMASFSPENRKGNNITAAIEYSSIKTVLQSQEGVDR